MIGNEALAAFQDSVTIGQNFTTLRDDTLAGTGTLLGRIVTDPSHNPQSVTIQIPGTDLFANCSKEGTFILPGMAAGEHMLRAASTEDKYTPTYVPVTVDPSQTFTARVTVDMIYTGIPSAKNIRVDYATITGEIHLSWDAADYLARKDYAVYIGEEEVLNNKPLATTRDTTFTDYVGRLNGSTTYYVAVRSKTLEYGPVFEGPDVLLREPLSIEIVDTLPLYVNVDNPLHANIRGFTGSVPQGAAFFYLMEDVREIQDYHSTFTSSSLYVSHGF